MKNLIAVGLSGGVDSAVTALLLKKQGYKVIGMFMKNWEEEDLTSCQSQADYEDVARVCEKIDIPFYTVNFTKEYWDEVFSSFLEELELGLTPNPDILCNQKIKFHFFLQKALSLNADKLATGHYAQIQDEKLLKGMDDSKDQSYFLYTLKKEQLSSILFPIGNLEKAQVRAIARKHDLPIHNKKDSTGICFIGKRQFKPFVQQYIKPKPGLIQSVEGKKLGQHDGIFFYTIGQRKGLGIGGPGDAWFVTGKDVKTNTLIVAQGENHPALFSQTLIALKPHFVDRIPNFPLACQAKIRYRQTEQDCVIEKMEDNKLHVRFQSPQRAITPGQSIVFYQRRVCLGGAIIQ